MARYFVRNLRGPTFSAGGFASHNEVLYQRELLLLAGWSEISRTSDVAWITCVPVIEVGGASGFYVDSTEPGIVHSSAGVFTSAHATNECAIFLKASNAQNRIAARIKRYISANQVEIDPDSAPPNGWITEGTFPGTLIPGRICHPKAATLMTSSWVLLQAPSGNNQARIEYTASNTTTVFARPKGGVPDATEVPAAGMILYTASDTKIVMNGVFEDPNALIYTTANAYSLYNHFTMWGELDNVATGDSDPGFVYSINDMSTNAPWLHPMYMLSGNPVSTGIRAYTCLVKQHGSMNFTNSHHSKDRWKLQNGSPGKAARRSPLVLLDNVLNFGGCIRGRLPLVRCVNTNFERWRPLDQSAGWLHIMNGLAVPRNGANDPLPFPCY